jgi:hypothetical protein
MTNNVTPTTYLPTTHPLISNLLTYILSTSNLPTYLSINYQPQNLPLTNLLTYLRLTYINMCKFVFWIDHHPIAPPTKLAGPQTHVQQIGETTQLQQKTIFATELPRCWWDIGSKHSSNQVLYQNKSFERARRCYLLAWWVTSKRLYKSPRLWLSIGIFSLQTTITSISFRYPWQHWSDSPCFFSLTC